ncbi:MAG: hypothetical protein V4812_11400 [Pseudomonadota bacterium]
MKRAAGYFEGTASNFYPIKIDPALRVARIGAPFGVEKLGKGMTIAGVPRLAWDPSSRHRNSRG